MSSKCLHISLLGEFQLSGGCLAPDSALPAATSPPSPILGPSGYHVPGDAVPELPLATARLQALLAYLLLHRHAPQSRAYLAFLFWPDTNEAQALTNLRNLLYKLRRALPDAEHFLRIDSRTVQWQPDIPVTLDIAAFEEAVAQATTATELAHAADLYHGDLLPNCYDEWIQPERERLRQLALNTLERLLDLLEAERNYHGAIRYGRRLLQLEPFNEAVYRRLMSLYAADADRAGALHTYQRCVAMLQEEFGATPDPTTEELYQRLQDSPSHAAAPPSTDEIPLVGRLVEWQQLRTCWVQTVSGKTHCLLLTGEAGIGKTRLAEELLGWVERQGFLTAAAHCYAAEGMLAYAPITTWLRTPAIQRSLATLDTIRLTEVTRLLPDLLALYPHLTPPGTLTADWQRQRLFEALAHAVLQVNVPLLLFLDDLQWCDRETLAWLHYLLRIGRERNGSQSSIAQAQLLLVGTVRTEALDAQHPLHELVRALYHDGVLTEVALDGLSLAETATLAGAVANRTFTTTQSAALYQATEGNPLFVVEMVQAGIGVEEGTESAAVDKRTQPGENRGAFLMADGPTALPPKVQTVIQARLAACSPVAREVAALAATIGRAFSYTVLANAGRYGDETLVPYVEELCQRRIVRERSAEQYDFSHEKLREVTYHSLSAARRRLNHRAVAQALEAVYIDGHGSATPQSPTELYGQIATHYALAGINEKAVHYYQQAAAAAHRISANQDAIRAYQRALELTGETPDQATVSVELYERMGDILCATGQYEEARTKFAEALAHTTALDVVELARLHRKVGSTWREQYAYPQAQQFYTAARHALETRTAPDHSSAVAAVQSPAWWEEWLQIHLEIDLVHYWLAEIEASDLLQQGLEPLVEEHGTPAQRATFFQRRAQLELRRHRSVATAEAVRYAQRSLAAYQAAAMHEQLPAAHFMLGFLLLWHDEPAEAAAELEQALTAANQSGDRSLQARALTYLAIAARRRNVVDETAQWAAQAITVATAAHMPEYIALAHANQAWLAWRQRDFAAVREHGRVARDLWQQLPVAHASAPFQWTALWPLLAAALAAEEPEAALASVHALLDPHQQQLPDSLVAPLTAAVQAGERNETEPMLHHMQMALQTAQELHYL